jgi:hypothetical protein
MKHLYEYDDEEIKSMMTDLEGVGHGQPKGWIIAIDFPNSYNTATGTSYLAIVAETIGEALNLFVNYLVEVGIVYEGDVEDMLEGSDNFYSIISDKIILPGGEDIAIINMWQGLTPISKNSSLVEMDTDNILYTMEELKKTFSNVESVLRQHKIGNL